jgi:Lectin C-type domain
MKNKIITAFVACACAAGTASAFKISFLGVKGESIHEQITTEALDSIVVFFEDSSPAKLSSEFKNAVAEENTENDEAGLDYGQMHFDDSRLKESAAYVWNAKLGAVEAFKNGNPDVVLPNNLALDGKGIQVNLGTAMHTIQDFFAHSTWVEINYSRNGNAPVLPVPLLGIVENPFNEPAFSSVEKLDVESSRSADGQPISDSVCGFSSVKEPTTKLTSAYYDLAMSDMPNLVQSTKDLGFYTDQWSSQNRTILGFLALKPTRFETSSPLGWPLGRCVHGGDAADHKGINKDQGLRVGHLHARKAAVQATRAFMLNFLASANVLAISNKKSACQYMFDCEEPALLSGAGSVIAPVTPINSATLGGSVPGTTLPLTPSNFVVTVLGTQETFGSVSGTIIKVSSNNWPAYMLSYSFDQTPCTVYRPFKLDDVSDLSYDKVICPSTKVGAGTLRVFQTALPKIENVRYAESITINAIPPAIADVQPKVAIINQPTTFTITGTNLLATAQLSFAGGGSCANPTVPNADPSTGFKQTCTPSGSAGTRSVSVVAQAGGAAIGASQTISVSAVPSVSTSLFYGLSVATSLTCGQDCIGANTTDGNLQTAANLKTYSGNFVVQSSTPLTLSRVRLIPSMSPNGNVDIEILTNSNASAATGTAGWISQYRAVVQMIDQVPKDFLFPAQASGVRQVEIRVHSSASWVAFYEIEGYLSGQAESGIVNPANGHRYEVITCGTWTQCDAAARAKGGNLVTIRNAAENAWLLANVLNTSPNAMFIGLYKTGATWAWSSGESAGFTAWLPNRPDNLGGNQNYVHISSGNQAWDDVEDAFYGAATQAIVEHRSAAAASNLITFEELPNQMTAMANLDSVIPMSSRLSNQYLATHGVAFTSTGGFAALVNHGAPTASNPNIIGGSTAAGQLSYLAPITIAFFNVADFSVKAVTNRFKIQGEWAPFGSGQVFATAFDISGNVIGTTSDTDNKIFGVSGPILEFNVAGIHRVVIRGDSGTVGFDQLEFGVLLVLP